MTTARQIGAVISARRKQLGFTQAELASRIALSQNRLSVLEKDASKLTAQQMLGLLNALGLDVCIQERSPVVNHKTEG